MKNNIFINRYVMACAIAIVITSTATAAVADTATNYLLLALSI